MNNQKQYNHRQLFSLALMIMLVPALRLFPTRATEIAGRACWLSPLVSLPFIFAWLYFLYKFISLRQKDEALPQLTLRLLGKKLGLAALIIQFIWLTVYAGFVLRSGADRLIVTIYPKTSASVFSVTMGILGLFASLLSARTLVRTAGLIRPILMTVLFLILIFAFFDIDIDNLLPVSVSDLPSVALAALLPFDIVSVAAYAVCFYTAELSEEKGRLGSLFLWAGLCLLIITLLDITITGTFGAELSSRLSRPFFVLVRNLVFFNSIERVEALVVMLWIFPDFLLTSMFISASRDTLLLILSEKVNAESIRLPVSLCLGLVVILLAIFIAPDSASLENWSAIYIPTVNLFLSLVFLPAIYITGKLRARQ